jgi:hypothetical protein
MSETSLRSSQALSQCPVCDSMDSAFVLQKDGYHLVRCAACASVYVGPILSDEFLAAHDQAGGYFEGDAGQGTAGYFLEVAQKAGWQIAGVGLAAEMARQAAQTLRRDPVEGQASAWGLALWTWRGIRVLGWGWHTLAHAGEDVYTTLEVVAYRPG